MNDTRGPATVRVTLDVAELAPPTHFFHTDRRLSTSLASTARSVLEGYMYVEFGRFQTVDLTIMGHKAELAAWFGAMATYVLAAEPDPPEDVAYVHVEAAPELPPCCWQELSAGEAGRGVDPNCRAALELPELHICTTSYGYPVRAGQLCHTEARRQMIEDAAALAAEMGMGGVAA